MMRAADAETRIARRAGKLFGRLERFVSEDWR
jgi:hypothetical protein